MSAANIIQRSLLMVVRNPLTIAIFTLLVMVGGGWVGDMIKGDCLTFGSARSCDKGMLDGWGILISLAVFGLGAGGLVSATKHYLPIRQLRAQSLGRGRKAIIISISTLTKDVELAADGSCVRKTGGVEVAVSGDIRRDIERLEPLKCNTQQFLRALAPHVEADVRHVVLLGSSGEEGSARLRPQYAALLRRYLPNARIDIDSVPVDLENLYATQNLIIEVSNELMKAGLLEKDIMIDVTVGNKMASIAAALATLHRPDLQFQYVKTGKPYDVMAFDVVSESQARMS